VVPRSEFVAPTTTPPPDATTTVPPATDPPTTEPLPPGPTIVSFTGPATVTCTEPTEIELSWETTDASSITIARDDELPLDVGPSGSERAPFPCDGASHRYVLTASNGAGQLTQQQLTVGQT